jgi:hypothetical protein
MKRKGEVYVPCITVKKCCRKSSPDGRIRANFLLLPPSITVNCGADPAGVSVGNMPLPIAREVHALAALHRQRGCAIICLRPDAPTEKAQTAFQPATLLLQSITQISIVAGARNPLTVRRGMSLCSSGAHDSLEGIYLICACAAAAGAGIETASVQGRAEAALTRRRQGGGPLPSVWDIPRTIDFCLPDTGLSLFDFP